MSKNDITALIFARYFGTTLQLSSECEQDEKTQSGHFRLLTFFKLRRSLQLTYQVVDNV
jgi:hypothetical protein